MTKEEINEKVGELLKLSKGNLKMESKGYEATLKGLFEKNYLTPNEEEYVEELTGLYSIIEGLIKLK